MTLSRFNRLIFVSKTVRSQYLPHCPHPMAVTGLPCVVLDVIERHGALAIDHHVDHHIVREPRVILFVLADGGTGRRKELLAATS
jgi:hypothetical protein